MKTISLYTKILYIVLLLSINSFASSKIDLLIEKKEFEKIADLISETKIIYSDTNLPDNSNDGDLIIISNEYEIKQFFEFYNGIWNEKVTEEIAKLLGNDSGTTYGNLFNYKVNSKEFNAYETDDFKYEKSEVSSVVVKIINSKNSEYDINNNINIYLKEHTIDIDNIINIQISDTNLKNCKIIIIYEL